ncbi:MAG: sigma 54-interacting transcriptional regulator [Oscillospiraceae bacterium]|nr:sigma 54-interacting transcriptional regulator [Oscillospiraceae bacterium]
MTERSGRIDAGVDFREVCENLYDAVHITDGEGRILFINEAYTRNTGIRPEKVLGHLISEFEGVLYRGSVTQRVLETKQPVNSIAWVYGLNKEVLVTGIPVFDGEGNIKLVVTNTRDFTELKHLEQQLQEMTEERRIANEELAYLRRQQAGDREMVYRSEAMRRVVDLLHTVADTDVTVLITGESGTGKELAASELYQNSSRRDKPFIKVNCAAIPGELLESELFGYEAGAFTGAKRSGKAGMFELANTGVILLDEIGDMPLALQGKLLRVLQQKELMRIGGSRPIKLDLRVIAATNKDLREEVRRGRFREDLFYRLNVLPIELKPLRERREDIPLLADLFFQRSCKKYNKVLSLSTGAIQQLIEYPWPGNIRELENLVERIAVTIPNESAVTREHVFAALNLGGSPTHAVAAGEGGSLREQVGAYERALIRQAIEREGSIRKAAKVLGVDHSTIVKKIRACEWDPPEGGEKSHQAGE